MFDATTENPELIWNDACRENVRQAISKTLVELIHTQSMDPSAKWNTVRKDGGFEMHCTL